jgi:hydroxymethylbilane synthase
MTQKLKLGTRGSPLALAQAGIVREALQASGKGVEVEIIPIKTSGDWHPAAGEQTFLDAGATKGLFTKEIEEALLRGTIDLAVHSMKDVSVWTPEGLAFGAFLRREDPRDALITRTGCTLVDLPSGAIVGTASLRRKAQLLIQRPDLRVVPLRGNVETRLQKLAGGEAEATLLAVAGLKRLGLLDRATAILDPAAMLPAPAQGVLGIEIRAEDATTRALIAPLHDPVSAAACEAERALLRALDGSCRTPIAALAQGEGDRLTLDALAARSDGSFFVRLSEQGPVAEAAAIGLELGARIRAKLPADFRLV